MKVSMAVDEVLGIPTVRVDRAKLVEAINTTAMLLQQLHSMLVIDEPIVASKRQPKRKARRSRQ